ncbi:hypothetical protein QNI15_38860, partial [Cytophagaceae bacterium NT2B1]|nr:hypothetical protein [Xanthocytophaga flavus]
MQRTLENLSKEELLLLISSHNTTISSLVEERDYLKSQLEMFKRMQFGQKRERFEADPNQILLPFDVPESEKESEQIQQKTESIDDELIDGELIQIEYTRKRANHHGRAQLPAHLPVEEIEIYPDGDLSQMICIGKEITEELECEPARFYIKRYIRYKYTPKQNTSKEAASQDQPQTNQPQTNQQQINQQQINQQQIKIGSLPERVIDKGIPGAGLLATILTDK